LIGTKAHENVGNSAVGVVRESQGVPKMFRAPICRAHCAVIFAIAQLSCLYFARYVPNVANSEEQYRPNEISVRRSLY